MLNPASDSASEPDGRPRSDSAPAKPKPWISPNPNAAIQRPLATTGNRLLSAASTTDSAIADSIQRDGSDTTPSAASDSVIECAMVNAVTILATSTNAARNETAGRHAPLRRATTAGKTSQTINEITSKPTPTSPTPPS